jgi:uncharacterized membrane protein YcgQ (UPF0703/DUF1980 family)
MRFDMKDNSTVKNLLIGACFFVVTLAFFSFQLWNSKKRLEEFNVVLGKNEKVNFTQILQTVLNDNKIGSFEENVKFTNANFKTDIIEIKEKMFIAQTNDIYLNSDDYIGKTIKLEGLFKIEDFSLQKKPLYYVLRYGPGCCGYDGSAGFEVIWDDTYDLKPAYPKEDDWAEAVGTLKTNEEDGGLYIALSQLTVSKKRGSEFVRQ